MVRVFLEVAEMRFTIGEKPFPDLTHPYCRWHKVFAWLPRVIDGEWVWLENIERRAVAYDGVLFDYRKRAPGGGPLFPLPRIETDGSPRRWVFEYRVSAARPPHQPSASAQPPRCNHGKRLQGALAKTLGDIRRTIEKEELET